MHSKRVLTPAERLELSKGRALHQLSRAGAWQTCVACSRLIDAKTEAAVRPPCGRAEPKPAAFEADEGVVRVYPACPVCRRDLNTGEPADEDKPSPAPQPCLICAATGVAHHGELHNRDGRPVHGAQVPGHAFTYGNCMITKVFYCGARYAKPGECACGRCDGVCGPSDGCPCLACRALVPNVHYSRQFASNPAHCRGDSGPMIVK